MHASLDVVRSEFGLASHGHLHRDLSEGNVLIEEGQHGAMNGDWKLLFSDLSFATMLNHQLQADGAVVLATLETGSQAVRGTPEFAARELMEGDATGKLVAHPKSDMPGVGLLVYMFQHPHRDAIQEMMAFTNGCGYINLSDGL